MRTIRDLDEALMEALVMLKVIERGGSYSAADWYERMNKLDQFLSPERKEITPSHVSFDLQACKAKISRK